MNDVAGVDDVFIDFFAVKKSTVGTIQVFDIGCVEVSEDAGVVGTNTFIGDVYIVILSPSQCNSAGGKFEFIDFFISDLLFYCIHTGLLSRLEAQ